MTMIGGLDVHRQQITFDYVDDEGLVHWGQIRPATRKTLRDWLAKHCPDGDGEFAMEGCTGWRYVSEELAAAGVRVHLGDPAEVAALRGPKKRAKTDRSDARLLRTLLLEGRFPKHGLTTGSHGVDRCARRRHLQRLRQSAPLPGAGERQSGDGVEVPGPKADQDRVAQRRRLGTSPVPVRDRDVL
ncbi:MAG: hypothetical protein ACLQIK_09250 [Mycobacterium sp.]|uniref:hypothetical protein n=1 Tax=Mycobacterium sp. TaxID=1785 RepID=UPI003F9B97BC